MILVRHREPAKYPETLRIKKCSLGEIKKAKSEWNRSDGYFTILAPWYEDDTFSKGDGYIQRIKDIDVNIFRKCNRVYLYNSPFWTCDELGLYRIMEEVIYIIYNDNNRSHLRFVNQMINQSRGCYIHSIYRLLPAIPRNNYKRARYGVELEKLKTYRVLDLHGMVSEEKKMYLQDEREVKIAENVERDVLINADLCIAVSQRMIYEMEKKYACHIQNSIVLPILPDTDMHRATDIGKDCNLVIYSGGVQKWQKVEDMLMAVSRCKDRELKYLFCVNDERDFSQILAEFTPKLPEIQFGKKDSDELFSILQTASLGFILRDNNAVNRVACPTKLVEYIQHKVIPIMDSPQIGDFYEKGLKYVSISDFVRGDIPNEEERVKMTEANVNIVDDMIFERESAMQYIGKTIRKGRMENQR